MRVEMPYLQKLVLLSYIPTLLVSYTVQIVRISSLYSYALFLLKPYLGLDLILCVSLQNVTIRKTCIDDECGS
jgi:hypothetical protein